MKEAQLVKDRNLAFEIAWEDIRPKTGLASRSTINPKSLPWSSTEPDSKTTRRVIVTERKSGPESEVPYKSMSEAKYQVRRDKGLCFRGDEKFFKGHRCTVKELRELSVWVGCKKSAETTTMLKYSE